ncbi:MAG: glycosyltransferase family 4 protein [Proteobacteria bacterium]|nr:glycosyltransferase family 4 protein [Pseudomonadota bacterium]MBU1593951.1 glycosyltransferase family 4 protein [Pseudomonadota bacterium]
MPRIALTMPRLGLYGGAEGFGWRLAEALAAEGHAVDFLCGRAEGRLPGGVRPVVLGRPPLGRALKNLWFAHAVERRLAREGYDLVIGLGRTWTQDLLRVGGGPQSVFNELTEAAHGSSPARLFKRLRRAVSPSSAVIAWLEARQFDAPASAAQHIVCVSDLVRDWLLRAHPALDPARVSVVYNRPDLARFAPLAPERRALLRSAQGLGDLDTVVCTAGTNFALKGVGTLIRALALLPPQFHLAVAGGRGPGRWLALARELGVAQRVRFAGKVDDMPGFYGASDVFALPTYYDACSNAVLEALACGLPSISSSRNGSAVFVPERHVLADPADARGLARLIREAAAEKDRPAFVWPDDRPCGLEPYLEMVRGLLARKGVRP